MVLPQGRSPSLIAVVTAVLIPMKSFDLAKGRLAAVLDESQRARLARRMAHGVIHAAAGLSTWVICDSHEVAALAVGHGANVIWRPARGLNAAVHDGLDALAAEGFDRVIISHADLPLARDLRWVGDGDGVTIVPDRRGDGTNVMSLPTNTGFQFSYGPGSAAAHTAEAHRIGIPVRLSPDPELGWDVDIPEDLTVLGIDMALQPLAP